MNQGDPKEQQICHEDLAPEGLQYRFGGSMKDRPGDSPLPPEQNFLDSRLFEGSTQYGMLQIRYRFRGVKGVNKHRQKGQRPF